MSPDSRFWLAITATGRISDDERLVTVLAIAPRSDVYRTP